MQKSREDHVEQVLDVDRAGDPAEAAPGEAQILGAQFGQGRGERASQRRRGVFERLAMAGAGQQRRLDVVDRARSGAPSAASSAVDALAGQRRDRQSHPAADRRHPAAPRSILLATRSVSGPGQAAAPRGVAAGALASKTKSRISASSARAQRAAQPFLLDRVVAVAQAGGVGEHDRIAGEVDRDLDDVARRAGDRRGDRRLAPRDPVQQARFAGVGRADDRDRDAVAQPLAAMSVGEMALDLAGERRGLVGDPTVDLAAADPRRENRSPLRDGRAGAVSRRAQSR